MRFYTNVQLVGNQFLVRGYDNGEHFSIREEYMPTLFVDSKKKSKYKTLEGMCGTSSTWFCQRLS